MNDNMRETIVKVCLETLIGGFLSYYLKTNNKKGVGAIVTITVLIILITIGSGWNQKTIDDIKNRDNSSISQTAPQNTYTDPPQIYTEDVISSNTTREPPLQSEISLLNIEPYSVKAGWTNGFEAFNREHEIQDIFGTIFSDAFVTNRGRDDDERYEIYAIDGQYTKLTFTIGVYYWSRGETGTGSLLIYTDGEKVFEESIPVDYKTQSFEIDLTNKRDLKIEMYGSYPVKVMLLNPTLHR